MSFKPKNTQPSVPVNPNIPKVDWAALNKSVKAGSRPARVSLIVDLGIQERQPSVEDYNPNDEKHKTALTKGSFIEVVDGKEKILTPRKPVQQAALLADLVNDVVDYGGEIGKQPYRIILNKSFKGELTGIDLAGCYSFDQSGKRLEDKPFTFHSQSLFTKLAKATNTPQIIDGGEDNMDISLLANKAFMAQIAVTESGDKTYVNYKGCAEVPMIPDEDGNESPMKIKALSTPARVITFDNVTEDDVKFLRYELVKKIKQAQDYQGSKMQAVLEGVKPSDVAEETKVEEPKVSKTKSTAKVEPVVETDMDFDDVPF